MIILTILQLLVPHPFSKMYATEENNCKMEREMCAKLRLYFIIYFIFTMSLHILNVDHLLTYTNSCFLYCIIMYPRNSKVILRFAEAASRNVQFFIYEHIYELYNNAVMSFGAIIFSFSFIHGNKLMVSLCM